jgi:hypothetical protein
VQLGMSALGQKRTYDKSFDHLVGATLHRLRHGNAERLRGPEVDDQYNDAPPRRLSEINQAHQLEFLRGTREAASLRLCRSRNTHVQKNRNQ